jgi:hypothetical protein
LAKKRLLGFLHTARLDTPGAYPESYSLAIPDRFDFLKIGVPSLFGLIVSVAHVITQTGFFSADIANF